jgi:hypothetical protein
LPCPRGKRTLLEIIGAPENFIDSTTAFGTTGDTEKGSVSSRKKIKRQRHAGREIDSPVEGEAVLGDRGINHYEDTEWRE